MKSQGPEGGRPLLPCQILVKLDCFPLFLPVTFRKSQSDLSVTHKSLDLIYINPYNIDEVTVDLYPIVSTAFLGFHLTGKSDLALRRVR